MDVSKGDNAYTTHLAARPVPPKHSETPEQFVLRTTHGWEEL